MQINKHYEQHKVNIRQLATTTEEIGRQTKLATSQLLSAH